MSKRLLMVWTALVSINLTGCAGPQVPVAKIEPTTLTEVTAWCKRHNELKIYPGAEAKEKSSQGLAQSRSLWTKDKIDDVDKWYLMALSGDDWSDWELWKREPDSKDPKDQLRVYFLSDGAVQMNVGIEPKGAGTSINYWAAPVNDNAEIHLQHYTCIRKSKGSSVVHQE